MIVVRPITVDDVEQYRTCRLDALRDSPAAFASSYEEESNKTVEDFRDRMLKNRPGNIVFGAFDGEKIVGLTGLFRENRLKRMHKVDIVSVFVRPEYRGQKIGARLIEAAIAHARTIEGVGRIELSVESNNTPAKALYTSFGFTTWGREPAFAKIDGKEYDEDYMSLSLS